MGGRVFPVALYCPIELAQRVFGGFLGTEMQISPAPQIVVAASRFSVALCRARSISVRSSLGAIAPTMLEVIQSCISKMFFSLSSDRSNQMLVPVPAHSQSAQPSAAPMMAVVAPMTLRFCLLVWGESAKAISRTGRGP